MRDLHARMLGAVLEGDGLDGVAELASSEVCGPVAIVLPARGLAASAPDPALARRLTGYVSGRIRGTTPKPPRPIELEVRVRAGEQMIGAVLLLTSDEPHADLLAIDRDEVLRIAALACLTEVAVADARDEVEHNLRGSLLDALRRNEIEGPEAVRRAARFGCELVRGAVAIVAAIGSSRPRHAAALIAGEYEGAIAELLDGRVYAILPARGGDDAPELTLDAARRLAERLRKHGPTAVSSFYNDPGELPRAIQEAELVLEVVSRDERMAEQLDDGISSGVYRLLFRTLISHPEEVHSFYNDTVAPIVRYDEQYRTELLSTLESYLAHDCNTNATARAIFAHRHTVAYRLERIKELSGLDPALTEDRERLGLGVKAYHIIKPTLPR